ncbi:hypothetical protein [Flavobacterium ovatum]|uniref:hypothetical protein n=1 Tax=Flavobacterium ovatum TaxID=1928857 RepID=UPI00344BBFDE
MKFQQKIGLVFAFISVTAIAQDIPNELKSIYNAKADAKYSDEFNGNRKENSFDTNKWHYRESTKEGLGQGANFVQEKDGSLICYGHKELKKGGAIISNNYFQYGFYAFKWKTTGIYENKRNAWHPSFWGSLDDTRGNKVPGTNGNGDSWMEIDVMEFSTGGEEATDWSTDAPCYIWNDSLKKRIKVNDPIGRDFGWKKAIMIDGHKDSYKGEVIGIKGFDQWQTLGMEYHPDYMQMWMLDGNQWVEIGNKVTFTTDDTPPTLRTVPKYAVKPLYWYLGTLFFTYGKTAIREDQITNSSCEVDWFHFHPMKK